MGKWGVMAQGDTTVVVATRNRRHELAHTLTRLAGLPERPPVIVVDNGSTDGTAAVVRRDFPGVRVVALDRNRGACARNIGVRLARTPYVAFSDDDSWWDPGALGLAANLFDAHPRLGLVAAHPVIGDERVPDPVAAAMRDSPLPGDELPGRPVLGFLACACVVRRAAFLRVGGFSDLLFFVGEERLLAYDLAAAGWALRYLPSVVAVHAPSPHRPPAAHRARLEERNGLLTAWLRRPMRVAAAHSLALAGRAARSGVARSAWASALPRLPAALAARRPLPNWLERHVRLLEEAR